MRWVVAAVLATGGCSFHGRASGDGGDDVTTDASPDAGAAAGVCPTIGAPPPSSTSVATLADLRAAVAVAAPGETIVIEDGTYDLTVGGPMRIDRPGVTVRSRSGDPATVILDGGGTVSPIISVRASDVTVEALTLRRAEPTAVLVEGSVASSIASTNIYDVTFLDSSGPAISALAFAGGVSAPFADGGTVACSRITITPGAANPCGAGVLGILGQAVRNWTVRNNVFRGLACPGQVRRNVWFRYGSRDIKIVANLFINSPMNIALGDEGGSVRSYVDTPPAQCAGVIQDWGGLICNNAIAGLGVPPISGNTDFEEGIILWQACDTWVLHNTVVSPGGAETFHDIEYRFGGSWVHLVNNLLLAQPGSRDGAVSDPAWDASNVLYTAESDFVDALGGDLRTSRPPAAPGANISALGLCTTDATGAPRNLAAPTPGAYER